MTTNHPRLLFNASELRVLRNQAARGLKAEILLSLRAVCARLMTPFDATYLDFRERRRDIWTYRNGIFTVLPALNSLAVCYAFTGDKAVGDFARDALMAIVKHGLADVKSKAYGADNEGWRHGPGHDKGNFAQTVALLYDFCHDRFTARQRARLADYARESMVLAEQWHDFDQAQVSNNRGMRGILANTWWCLAFEGDTKLKDVELWHQRGLIAAEKFLFMAFDADGAPYEGPSYASSMSFVAITAEALRRRGFANLQTNNRFERFPEYLLYEQLPGGGTMNDLNDCNEGCGSISASLPLMGSARGRLLPWLAHQLDLHPSRATEWNGDLALYFLLWWKPKSPIQTPGKLGYPLSRCFRTRGVASLRTGWGADDWLVSHFCGRQERSCHRQGDYNHVAFYALGEKFLVDAGYGNTHRDPRKPVDRWFGLTASHNCVLIDGMNQRGVIESPGWAEGEMLDFQHTKDFDTSLGDASSATGPDHRVRCALRRVVLVRKTPCPYVAVVDVNEKDGKPFLAEALWHTSPENRIELNGSKFLIQGKQNDCVGQVLWPRNARLTLTADHGRPQLRVAVKARCAELVTVFCPVPRGAKPPRFSCKRVSEGQFSITCAQGARKSRLLASAVTEGVTRSVHPVRLS
jgi:hypothetical protein